MTKIGHTDGTDGGSMASGKNDVLLKITLAITSISLIVNIVACAFPDWLVFDLLVQALSTYNLVRVGIFYACDDLYGCNNPDTKPHDWQKIAAGMQGIGIFFTCLTILAIVLHLCRRSAPWVNKLNIVALLGSWASSAFLLVAAIILYTNRENVLELPITITFEFGWALILSTANACVLAICGVLIIVHIVI